MSSCWILSPNGMLMLGGVGSSVGLHGPAASDGCDRSPVVDHRFILGCGDHIEAADVEPAARTASVAHAANEPQFLVRS